MLHKAYRYSCMIILYILYVTSFNMRKAGGATYIVGDNDGWEIINDYTSWNQRKRFHVGDILVFNYDTELHNVMQVNSNAYANCAKDSYLGLYTTGNDSVVLSEVGDMWFICGVSDHCENGQKLGISVAP